MKRGINANSICYSNPAKYLIKLRLSLEKRQSFQDKVKQDHKNRIFIIS